MRKKELHSVYDVKIRGYKIEQSGDSFLHSFTPASTETIYQFFGNSVPVLIEGEHYNVAYSLTADGKNIVDPSVLSLASEVNPILSYLAAKNLAIEKFEEEKEKNDTRTQHEGTGDYFWAKKQAWRLFGAFMSEGSFIRYLEEISHPSVPCLMVPEDHPPSWSTAYAESGLEEAAFRLISTARKKTPTLYSSELYSKTFAIKGISAISHKK